MTASHNDLISLNFNLSAPPQALASFGNVALLAADVAFGGGARAKVYTSYQGIVDDGPSGTGILSAGLVEAGLVAFSQNRKPAQFLIITVDVSGTAETYEDALLDAVDQGYEFFGVVCDLHDSAVDAAQQVDLSDTVETLNKVLVLQIDDADAYDTPANWAISAYSGLLSNENTVLCFHDDETQWHDVALAISRLNYDLDTTSPTWTGELKQLDPAGVTDAQKLAIKTNNINVALAFGTAVAYSSDGVNVVGRPVDHLVAVYWWLDRLDARLKALKLSKDAAGEKIPMTVEGQDLVRAQIVAQQGVAVDAGHFVQDQVIYTFPDPIPDADIEARVIKATVDFQLASGAISFDLTFNFSATPII